MMRIVISPAKSLNYEDKDFSIPYTQPQFGKQAEKLIKKLRKLKPADIEKLMKISAKLGELNFDRYQAWSLPFTEENSKQALLAFTGEVYRGIDANSLDGKGLKFAQDHLRILSGLYGLLKPLDLMQAYRLEMGTKFEVDANTKNLYAYWKEAITKELNKELDGSDLINLASNEYFKAVDQKKLNSRIITPTFKELKNGEYKIVMTYAKLARGLMTRFIIDNQITETENIKAFDYEGYIYNSELSSDKEWVFTR